ncbi:DUF4291 domain-containing protein [Polaribacter reichenbachii]|uniref:DUF4291 domain-containing protein n=1 Tax=Polaribacter reichenbachii TaxID=996801 RepID=UPI0011125E70|nr:DUF4291 domain-containing protein [Polaribacter reichenbachii]
MKKYAKDGILEIEDISKFIKTQHQFVINHQLDQLVVPEEKPFIPSKKSTFNHLKLSNF